MAALVTKGEKERMKDAQARGERRKYTALPPTHRTTQPLYLLQTLGRTRAAVSRPSNYLTLPTFTHLPTYATYLEYTKREGLKKREGKKVTKFHMWNGPSFPTSPNTLKKCTQIF
jgi:hypothetical protein